MKSIIDQRKQPNNGSSISKNNLGQPKKSVER